MNREAFHREFQRAGPVVLPVVHVLDDVQAERNVRRALAAGAQGVFLINHDFPHAQLLPVIAHVRRVFPGAWLGVNFLAVTGEHAFPVLGALARDGVRVDAYWADDACIDEHAGADQEAARAIARARVQSGWHGLYFGGTAFKKQRHVCPSEHAEAARRAGAFMDVVTTSGVATGEAADLAKIDAFREGCGRCALALASGVTPDNAARYAQAVDCFMVATGINFAGDFYNIDPARLQRLLGVSQQAADVAGS